MIRLHTLVWRLFRGVLALVVIWGLLVAALIFQLHKTRLNAGSFLADFKKLEVGKSRMDEVSFVASKYQGTWRPRPSFGPESPCGGGASVIEFVFDNYLLYRLSFYSMTRFGGTVYVKDNLVCFLSSGIFTAEEHGGADGVYVAEFRESPFPSPFSTRLNHATAIVAMDVRAASDARVAAYALNLDCLTKVRGCRDTEEMAPVLGQNSLKVGPSSWKTRW